MEFPQKLTIEVLWQTIDHISKDILFIVSNKCCNKPNLIITPRVCGK